MNVTTSKRWAAVLVLLAVPALSSCGVNFKAQTDQVYTPAEGVSNRDGDVDVLNALIVSDVDGSGRFIAGLSNNTATDDVLTGVTGVGVDQSITFTLDDGDFNVPGLGYLQLADEGAGVVAANGDQVKKGYFVTVELTFSNAEPVEMQIPVVPPGEDFRDVTIPAPAPSAGAGG